MAEMPNVSPATVYDALQSVVVRFPDKVAIVFEEQRLTYKDVSEQVENAARFLHLRGIGNGDTFAAFSQNRPEQMYCYYAAAKLGALFVPINPNLTQAEVEYTFEHSGAKLLLHDTVVAETAERAVAPDLRVHMDVLTSPIGECELPNVSISKDDDFLIIYTSGSTGTPKGIVLSHAAQVGAPASLAQMWCLTNDDTTLVALPIGYLYGLSTAAANGLHTGGGIVILRRFHPRDVLEGLVSSSATVFHGVPTMFSMMLEYCEQRDLKFDLSGMRKLIVAGAPLSEEMATRFSNKFGIELENYYAMTEATPVFGRYADDPTDLPEGSIGRLAPGTAIRILRADGTECAVGEDGELFVRAAATLSRYVKNPELTQESMMGDLFRSGDLVRQDENGFFYITGRIKDIIIRGGANISPSEVEKVLITHPGVQDAAVVGVSERIFGEVPVAVVVRRHGSTVTQEELISHVELALSDFKVPRTIIFEAEMPQGKTGKVDKKELKQRLEVQLAS